jgi:hypothetical protein
MMGTKRRRGQLGAASLIAATLTCAASVGAAPPAAPATPGTEATDAAHSSPPDRAACLEAHHQAQELRKSGLLVEAGKKLVVCASATCPGPIISDCGTWTSELEQATPSMVFEVEVDGRVATEAKVTVDGSLVSDWSHAVAVNPGSHQVHVEVPLFPPHDETVPMAEGHRMRLVSVKFATPKPTPAVSAIPPEAAAPAPTGPRRRPVPVLTYPLLAGGIAGLAVFGVLDGLGKAKQTSLEHSCAPGCPDSGLRAMKNDYLGGDIALGVGVAALAGAAIVYFGRPEEANAAPAVSVNLGSSGVVTRGGSWGASATMRW